MTNEGENSPISHVRTWLGRCVDEVPVGRVHTWLGRCIDEVPVSHVCMRLGQCIKGWWGGGSGGADLYHGGLDKHTHTWHVLAAVHLVSWGGSPTRRTCAPCWVSHTMGLPFLFAMLPVILPNPNLQKHKKAAYIPCWRGEARWQLQARSLGPVVMWIGQTWGGGAVVKPQLGPAWAFTKGLTTQVVVVDEEQERLTWLTWR